MSICSCDAAGPDHASAGFCSAQLAHACMPAICSAGQHGQLNANPPFTEQVLTGLLRKRRINTQLCMLTCKNRLPACKGVQASQDMTLLMYCPGQLQHSMWSLAQTHGCTGLHSIDLSLHCTAQWHALLHCVMSKTRIVYSSWSCWSPTDSLLSSVFS